MRIIIVNISRNIRRPNSVIHATKRAWKLNIRHANNADYVIGVTNGSVQGYFKILNVINDRIHPDRIAFKLRNCTRQERTRVDNRIRNENLKRFVTKYI